MIDMVSTIDGKTVSGGRDETVVDLGSPVDHQAMQDLQSQCDAVMVGAGTLRSSGVGWNPISPIRVVVSGSGRVPFEAKFFTGGEGIVATPTGCTVKVPDGVKNLEVGSGTVDLGLLLQKLKDRRVERLLVLGGSELNGQLLGLDLVDELFLTIAPKVKLGRNLPTYAGGEPLARNQLRSFQLIQHHVEGSEVFLRYRRKRESGGD